MLIDVGTSVEERLINDDFLFSITKVNLKAPKNLIQNKIFMKYMHEAVALFINISQDIFLKPFSFDT